MASNSITCLNVQLQICEFPAPRKAHSIGFNAQKYKYTVIIHESHRSQQGAVEQVLAMSVLMSRKNVSRKNSPESRLLGSDPIHDFLSKMIGVEQPRPFVGLFLSSFSLFQSISSEVNTAMGRSIRWGLW